MTDDTRALRSQRQHVRNDPGSCTFPAGAWQRRALIGAGFGLISGTAQAQSDPAVERPRQGDLLVRIDDQTRTPLTAETLHIGDGQMLAWPLDPVSKVVRDGSRLNKVLIVRLDPAALDAQTAARAADGIVAYSAICPHAGCEVVNWLADRRLLDCPCHNSEYDPKSSAKVVGGPSPRSLAALPLQIVDNRLAVAHPFIGHLGIQQV